MEVNWHIINRKPKGHTVPAKLQYKGKTYTDKHDIVNQFNEYFKNIGPNLASTIHSRIKTDAFLPATHSSSFFLSPVNSAQVELALSGLDRHKATIDIPNYLIKIASNLLSTPLTNVFNESIESGIVPGIFKISKVAPVFKTGAVTDPGNYRPIAVLSPFAEILERLVYNQLSHFLEKENILFKHQFGFRKNYSTEQAILELTDNLKMKIDSNEAICSIFLDLSKAFDTVNHQILLQKLYRYGIRGVPLQWFKSYLESRTQYVEVENATSNPLSIQCGVSQGSTPGPLLFFIYINDMHNCLEKANIRTFTDDTTLFYSSNSLQDLEKTINEVINHLLSFCSANKLSVNFKKTHYMTISSPKKANKLKLNLRNIEEKNFIKYPGIYIDKNLNWAPHIQHINGKISKNVGILFRLRHFLTLNTLKQIYYSHISPHLYYGIMSWETHTQVD